MSNENFKKVIYIIGGILAFTSIPVFFSASAEGYSPFWGILPLAIGLTIVLYNRFNKNV